MHSKKIIASGLVIGLTVSSLPTESMANTLEEYKMTREEKQVDSSNENNVFENLIKSLFVKKSESKEVAEVNKNIVKNSVYEITLGEGQSVEDLTDNPSGYETIVVKTTGNKLLDATDFSRLNASKIPNIDLSNAKSNSIPGSAFSGNTSLKTFKFPQGVKSISNNAFKDCSQLTGNLVIPESVTSIGGMAYTRCSGLTGDLIIPDSVTTIASNAFFGCSGFNGRLVLSNSLKTIEYSVFYNCSGFTGKLVIPESVTAIGSNAFSGCNKFTGDLIIPNSVTSIANSAFSNCSGFNGRLVLSDSITSLGASVFQNCSGLKGDLIIPDSLTTIESRLFSGCSGFTGKLIIPDSITTIGANAFYYCSGFTGLSLSNSLVSIGESAFGNCKNISGDVYMPNNLSSLGNNVFMQGGNAIKFVVKIDKNDETTEYKREIINKLPLEKVKIEAPYDMDFTGTWMETSNIKPVRPIIKSVNTDGVEVDIVDDKNEKIVLSIPLEFIEDESSVFVDGEEVKFPKVNDEGRYVFTKEGDYELKIKTKLETVYNLEFKIRTKETQEAENLVNSVLNTTPSVETLSSIREKVNALPESFRKEELQLRLSSVFPNLTLDREKASANLDVYIKCENMLSLSLDTNSVTFDNYSGTEDMILSKAVNLTVNSSLPYKVNAYLESDIENKDGSNSMDISLLNIKANTDTDYKEFVSTKTPVVLLDSQPKGNGNIHSIDLKLKGSLAHEADVYKTTIKFEIEQK